jgi:cytochrome-b5 reductase
MSGLPADFKPLKLIERKQYNHNSDIFTFALEDPSAPLGLKTSAAIFTRCTNEKGENVVRPYTPLTTHENGKVTLIVKRYDLGVMSRHIHSLKVGDSLEIKGPIQKLVYRPNMVKQVVLIVGGTGIAPALQIIETIVSNPEDKTAIHLIFSNTSTKDILLREKIEEFAANSNTAGREFKITYFLYKPEEGSSFPVGYYTLENLKSLLPPASQEVLVYVCGVPKMVASVCGLKAPDFTQGEVSGFLKELGFDSTNVFKL